MWIITNASKIYIQFIRNIHVQSFLILAHHASIVIVCPRHSTICILKLLYFKKVVWIILETSSDMRQNSVSALGQSSTAATQRVAGSASSSCAVCQWSRWQGQSSTYWLIANIDFCIIESLFMPYKRMMSSILILTAISQRLLSAAI